MGRNKKATGLGDVIANITTAVGIEPCDGCNKRKEQLNKLFPFLIYIFINSINRSNNNNWSIYNYHFINTIHI